MVSRLSQHLRGLPIIFRDLATPALQSANWQLYRKTWHFWGYTYSECFDIRELPVLFTYVTGHYNPSVRIIDLVSHTICVVCVNFINKWRDLQFEVDSERTTVDCMSVSRWAKCNKSCSGTKHFQANDRLLVWKNWTCPNLTTRTTQNSQFWMVHNHLFASCLKRNPSKTDHSYQRQNDKLSPTGSNNLIIEHSKHWFDESSAV